MSSLVSADRSRQNLRLEPAVWERIDASRSKRPGSISRNTWITEAILEKLTKEEKKREIEHEAA